MAGIDPWTGARLGDDNDAVTGGTFLARVVTDLRTHSIGQFATVSDRDAAVTALTTAGATIRNGMLAWTDDAGWWARIGGNWVPKWRDTGWQNITPNTPFVTTAGGAGNAAGCRYRVVGDVCHWTFRISRTTSNWTAPVQIFTFPVAPSFTHHFRVTKDATDGVSSGMLSVFGGTGVAELNFNGAAGNDLYASGSFPTT